MNLLTQKWNTVVQDVEGATMDEKFASLVAAYARHRLQENQHAISSLEAQYGMAFEEFSQWLHSQPDEVRHRHDMERTFMEWEGYEDARKHWMQRLQEVRRQAAAAA
jgi:hypothetical protein